MKYTQSLIRLLYSSAFVTLLAHVPSYAENSTTQPASSEQPAPKKQDWKARRRAKHAEKEKTAAKGIKKMSYEELKARKGEHITANNKEAALKVLELMLPLCNDLKERHDLMLEVADLEFELGDPDKAGTIYKEFCKLYPSSSKVEYALYKSLCCSFKQISDAERDQTKTKEAIELAQTFLERSDVFTTYTKDVNDVLTKCHQRLFESEMNIATFYAKRGSNEAAHKRAQEMRTTYLPVLPESEPLILAFEYDMATKQSNFVLAQQKKLELATKFPSHSNFLVAEGQLKRKLVNRF
ncbi:MAG TPA: outer membrane protein assembly factor BamD [Candidatus Limnocylindria bacterium]|nr:outer membrane protein assembly factor BamD [Candidatus Limnocylindria bacterium]